MLVFQHRLFFQKTYHSRPCASRVQSGIHMDNRAIRMDNIVIAHAHQVERLVQKLATRHARTEPTSDPELAPLLPGYAFDYRLTAGTTPIQAGGLLDFTVQRPGGMDGWIINLTIKGRGRVFEGDKGFEVGPGDLLLLPPGVEHSYGLAPNAKTWWHRWVYFQPRAHWAAWLKWETQTHGVNVLRHRDDDLLLEQDRLFAEITRWSADPQKLSLELAMNLVERLLLLCSKQNQAPKIAENSDERLLLACKFMTDNLHRHASVEEVAAHANLSASRLMHLFALERGTSVMRWWEQQRIQLASQILRITKMPVQQVAAQVGYEDPLYFSRVFRKHAGVSPKEFRARHANLEQ